MAEIHSGERTTTTEAMHEAASRAASGFSALGIGAGDVVSLVLRNDFAFFEASSAAGVIGAYPTPVNWHATVPEARYLFEDSGAKAIVIHADLLASLREAIPAGVAVFVVPTPPEIAAAYGIAAELCAVPTGATAWADLIAANAPYAGPQPEPPGSIIYTSGTTGHPKGVRRAAPNAQQAVVHRNTIRRGMGFDIKENPADIITVITGPMYHSAPNGYGTMAARIGATVILQPKFDAEDLLRLIEERRVTHLHMVPIMFNRLLRLEGEVKAKYDLSSLEYVVHAAAPIAPAVKRGMIEWWGPVIVEYFGSTETGLVVIAGSAEWLAHPGTVGKAIPEARVAILGPEGEFLSPGEVGEVAARNVGIADFTYQGDDEKRRNAGKHGLICPGDLGYLDQDGFLYLVDRAKDIIISGGANIYPAEIEAELHKMPGLADVAVFGIPDEEFGEAVHAIVQPQPGAALTAEEVRAYLKGKIASYKIPRTVDFAADLPREDSGKIFKRKLRDPFWEGAGRQI